MRIFAYKEMINVVTSESEISISRSKVELTKEHLILPEATLLRRPHKLEL